MGSPTCSQIISRLNLQGNPDGGYYAQTSRDSSIVLSKSLLPSRWLKAQSHRGCSCNAYGRVMRNGPTIGIAFPPFGVLLLARNCGKITKYKVDRPVSTSVYSLLPSGSVTHLHRLPCAETLHFYLGEPLTVFELYDDGSFKLTCVGSDLLGEDQQPQYTVPPYVWFSLFPTNDYTISTDGAVKVHRAEPRDAENHYSLLGATCAPAFQIEDAEVAKRVEFASRFPHLEPLIYLLTLPD